MAQNDAVEKELEIIDAQAESIAKVVEETRQRPRGERPDFRSMSEAEREKLFAEMRARREKEAKEGNEKLAKILFPEQMKRLKEISLQLRGVSALRDPEIATALGLKEDQKKKIETVSDENRESMRTKMREIFQARQQW